MLVIKLHYSIDHMIKIKKLTTEVQVKKLLAYVPAIAGVSFTTVGSFCKLIIKRGLFSNYLSGGLFLFALRQRQGRNSTGR